MGAKVRSGKVIMHQGPMDGKVYSYPLPLPKTLVLSEVSHTKDQLGRSAVVFKGHHDYERLSGTTHYVWKGKVERDQ